MTYAAADIANGGGGSGGSVPGRDGRPFVGRLTPGTKVDRYQVLGAIGRGGMGEVYAAYHPDLDRRIALKVVYAAGAGGPERWVRLLREARTVARLSHPNVITVYDAGTLDGGIYIAMEFVEGETIDQWLRSASASAARSWREIVDVFLAAGRGLAAAHAAGVVHRDFKPQNVMVGRDGGVRVMDFGLARMAEGATDDERAASDVEGKAAAAVASVSVTKTGAVLGTPAYMAPEQFQGTAVDARADQFSFCVALHEALFGARPTMSAPVHDPTAVRSNAANVPARLKAVIRRGLVANREHRYASMDDLLRALERTRTIVRPRVFAAAGGLAIALVLLGGWRATRHATVSCVVPNERLAAWSGRDDARRQAIHHAFLASSRPTAETSWQRVSTALDEHVRKWAGMYVESCEATHVRGEQSAEALDLRTSCLNESLDEVRALTDVLVTADAAAVARSSTVVRDLTPVGRCADLDVLRSAVALPRDPATLAAVQRLRATLRTVRAQADLGNHRGAARAAEALRPEVETLAYKPLLAEVLQTIGEGTAEYEPRKAERTLEEAFLAAQAVGDGETAVRAASGLTFVVGSHHAGRGTEAKRWARIAAATLDGLKGNKNRLRGWISNDLAAVLAMEGNCEEASVLYQRAIALKKETLGSDHPDVAISLNNFCQVLSCLGKFREAVEAGDEAVAIIGKNPDSEVCVVANAFNNRGHAQAKLGRHTAADADFNRALAMYQADPATPRRRLAEPLHGLGEVRLAQGEVPVAISYLERALELRALDEVDPALIADTRFALARALWMDGGDRRRPRALAVAARDGYETKRRPEAAEVAEWLKSHPSGRR